MRIPINARPQKATDTLSYASCAPPLTYNISHSMENRLIVRIKDTRIEYDSINVTRAFCIICQMRNETKIGHTRIERVERPHYIWYCGKMTTAYLQPTANSQHRVESTNVAIIQIKNAPEEARKRERER